MPNAPHILETAMLLLIAFLVGAVLGYVARRLAEKLRARPSVQKPTGVIRQPELVPASVAGHEVPETAAVGVAGPALAAVSPGAPSEENFAAVMEALTATSPLPEIARPVSGLGTTALKSTTAADAAAMQPARKAGQTTSGRMIASPLPEPAPAPEFAAEAVAASESAAAPAAVPRQPVPDSLSLAALPDTAEAATPLAEPEKTAEVEPQQATEPMQLAARPVELETVNAADAPTVQQQPAPEPLSPAATTEVTEAGTAIGAQDTAGTPAADPEPALAVFASAGAAVTDVGGSAVPAHDPSPATSPPAEDAGMPPPQALPAAEPADTEAEPLADVPPAEAQPSSGEAASALLDAVNDTWTGSRVEELIPIPGAETSMVDGVSAGQPGYQPTMPGYTPDAPATAEAGPGEPIIGDPASSEPVQHTDRGDTLLARGESEPLAAHTITDPEAIFAEAPVSVAPYTAAEADEIGPPALGNAPAASEFSSSYLGAPGGEPIIVPADAATGDDAGGSDVPDGSPSVDLESTTVAAAPFTGPEERKILDEPAAAETAPERPETAGSLVRDEPGAESGEGLPDPAVSGTANLVAESQPAPDAMDHSPPAAAVESGTPHGVEASLAPLAEAAPLDVPGGVDQPEHGAEPALQSPPAALPESNASTLLPIETAIREALGTTHEDSLLADSEPWVEATEDAVLPEQPQRADASVVFSRLEATGGDPTEFSTGEPSAASITTEDEAAGVERRAAKANGNAAQIGSSPPASADQRAAEMDEETAAMRAIEGSWTPRRAAPSHRVELPEGSAEEILLGEPDRGRPSGLEAPRGGARDDLTLIRGLVPVMETALNRLGIYHFDQLAALDAENVAWIENHIASHGRMAREHWQSQARALAANPGANDDGE